MKGVFGMNIGGMTADNPSWGLFFTVTIPGTAITVLLLLCARRLWGIRSQMRMPTVEWKVDRAKKKREEEEHRRRLSSGIEVKRHGIY